MVGAVFSVVLFLLARGEPEDGPGIGPAPSPDPSRTAGVLVYVAAGPDPARLWRWDLSTGEVAKGPAVRQPVALVNVRSPGYGWLGLTSDLGDGTYEAATLDALGPDARPERIGRGDIVTWARFGASVVLVDRGSLRGGCRDVRVTGVHVGTDGRERVMRDRICGDVLSAGRTNLGYFLTLRGSGGVDVVGAGYEDAGSLLPDHGVIGISPGGDMIVTPGEELARSPAATGSDAPPPRVAGAASFFTQFGGEPVPYLVGGEPLRIDEVLAYGPGSAVALVLGRAADRAGLWEVALGVSQSEPKRARFVAEAPGSAGAAYATDGSAFVVADGRLWRLRDDRLTPLDLPEGAPPPTGPVAWILREPLTEL